MSYEYCIIIFMYHVVIMHCILNKIAHTSIKYSSCVLAAGTVAKWNPFLLNRRVIKLIAVLVLN